MSEERTPVFDDYEAIVAMRRRHAEIGRRLLAIAVRGLEELEAKVAAGEQLDNDRARREEAARHGGGSHWGNSPEESELRSQRNLPILRGDLSRHRPRTGTILPCAACVISFPSRAWSVNYRSPRLRPPRPRTPSRRPPGRRPSRAVDAPRRSACSQATQNGTCRQHLADALATASMLPSISGPMTQRCLVA